MKTEITKGGLLEIKPETGIETFALRMWATEWLDPSKKGRGDLTYVSKRGVVIDLREAPETT